MKNEIILNVKDLLMYIVLRWRMILIWGIIFAIGFNSLSVFRSYRTAQMWKTQAQEKGEKIHLSSYTVNLSDQEQKEVEDVFESYTVYQETYNSSLEYYNESVWMQMDPTSVDTIKLQYFIDNTKKAPEIISSYDLLLSDETVYEEINDLLGWEIESSYVKELIKIEKSYTDNDIQSNANGEREDNKDLMNISIIAPTKKECETIASVIDNKIMTSVDDMANVYGMYNIKRLNQVYYQCVDDELLQAQQSLVSNLKTLKDSMNVLKNNFTEEQKSYYNALIENADGKDLSENIAAMQTPSVQIFDIKSSVLGAFIGIFLYVLIVFIMYILRSTLRSSSDMMDYFEVDVIGTFPKTEKKKFGNKIDKFIEKLFHSDSEILPEKSMMQMISLSAMAVTRKKDVKQIYVLSASNTKETINVKEKVSEKLKNDGFTVTAAKTGIDERETMHDILSSDGVIIVEQIGESSYSAIWQEVKYCNKFNIPIIGSVIVK